MSAYSQTVSIGSFRLPHAHTDLSLSLASCTTYILMSAVTFPVPTSTSPAQL